MKPHQDAKEDYHYERQGVRALFMFFDPLRGWRRVSSREHRTRIDWAEEIRQLLDEDYPHARCVSNFCVTTSILIILLLWRSFST
jgi:hypothetical protein